jgi:hypothetical protein
VENTGSLVQIIARKVTATVVTDAAITLPMDVGGPLQRVV